MNPAPQPSTGKHWRRWTWPLLPLACHVGFSWIGFNPTDDGWLQAVARRLLDGEVPHRDFIFVRPALSAFLQVPLVWVGGEHTLWLARLWGWLTIGAIAWLWSGLMPLRDQSTGVRWLHYAVIFLLTAHVFPVMAWHSLDGMLFSSTAVALASRGTRKALCGAFACAGLAALCRQNFAFFPLFLLLGISSRDKWRALPWVATGPLVYAAYLGATGSLHDFIEQMLATRGGFAQGAWSIYSHYLPFQAAIPAGALLLWLLYRLAAVRPAIAPAVAAGLVLCAALLFAKTLGIEPKRYHAKSYVLFGFLLGMVGAAGWIRRPLPARERLVFITIPGFAWVTAISIGYNSPALASGLLFGLLVWLVDRIAGAKIVLIGSLVAATLVLGAAFSVARQAFPYRDQAVQNLGYETGPYLPGAAGMRTNEATHAVLADLQRHIRNCEAENRPYVVLTDGSAIWVRSRQRNLLPVEWAQNIEIGQSPALIERMTDAIRRLPPNTHIFVQRCLISELRHGFYAVPDSAPFYAFQNWVVEHCPKVKSSGYYDIFLPPDR